MVQAVETPERPRWRWAAGIVVGVTLLIGLNAALWGLLLGRVTRAYADTADAWRARPDLPHPDRHALRTDNPAGEDNAAYWYTKAMGAMLPMEQNPAWEDFDAALPTATPLPPRRADQIRELVSADEPAIGFAREARRHERVDWGNDGGNFNTLLPRLNTIRDLASRMSYRAAVARHDADVAEWLATVDQIEHLSGVAIHYGPSLVSGFVSTGLDAMACSRLREGLQHEPPSLNRGQWLARIAAERESAHHLMTRLLDDERHVERLQTSWRGEAAMLWASGRMPMTPFGPTVPRFLRPVQAAGMLAASRAVDRRTTAEALHLPRRTASLPNPSARPTFLAEAGLGWSPSLFSSTPARADVTFFRALTERRASAVLLGVVLFEADHNRLPDTLDELVGDYLPNVPLDPFDPAGGPLRWSTEDRVRVWSVAEDGIDGDGDTTPTARGVSPDSIWHRSDAVFALRPPERLPGEEEHFDEEDGPGGEQPDDDEQHRPADE